MTTPMTTPARQAKREHYRHTASQDADRRERSLKCTWGRHAGDRDGCANDGTSCLCECHDPL